MSSNDSSSKSTASGSQGTGLWVTAAIAMAIIVGGPLLIHSGAERGESRESAGQEPSAAVVSTAAPTEVQGSPSVPGVRMEAGAAPEGQEPVAKPEGTGVAFGPGPRRRTVPAEVPTPEVAAGSVSEEPPPGPTPQARAGESSPSGAEPVVTDQGPSHTGSQEMGAAQTASAQEPYPESADESVAGSSVASDEPPLSQRSVAKTMPEGTEPVRVDQPPQVPLRGAETAGAERDEAPSWQGPGQPEPVAPVMAAATIGETSMPLPRALVDSPSTSPHLAEVMAELRSMKREVEMEQRAAEEATRSYYPSYGRPYYPFRSVPGRASGGYGDYRHGPPRYYPPRVGAWGYPGPVPRGVGRLP